MKKLLFFSLIAISITAISFFNNLQSNPTRNLNRLADVRLSMAEIEKNIENKIDFILENVVKYGATPTTQELKSLISSIKTVRAYGKDITKNSKIKLLKIVKKLADENYKDIKILKTLKDISITSQQLTA